MTMPVGNAPDGAYVLGTVDGSQTDWDADGVAIRSHIRGKALPGFETAQNSWFDNLIGTITGGSFFNFGGLSTWSSALTTKVDQTKASLEYEVPRLDNRIDQLANGETIYLFTSHGTFTKPAGATRIGIGLVGGGDGGWGGAKQSSPQAVANGGTSGGYIFKWFDTELVPASLAVTIGGAGTGGPGRPEGLSSTYGGPQAGTSGLTTSCGSVLASIENGLGLIISEEGILSAPLSAPGSGGAGGSQGNGSAGGSTGWKNGGSGGTNSIKNGTVGQSVDLIAGDPFSGGGGGGGGYSGTGASFNLGYRGSNGGWPGAGGGGGGSCDAWSGASSGAGGNGAAGAVRIIVKYS